MLEPRQGHGSPPEAADVCASTTAPGFSRCGDGKAGTISCTAVGFVIFASTLAGMRCNCDVSIARLSMVCPLGGASVEATLPTSMALPTSDPHQRYGASLFITRPACGDNTNTAVVAVELRQAPMARAIIAVIAKHLARAASAGRIPGLTGCLSSRRGESCPPLSVFTV